MTTTDEIATAAIAAPAPAAAEFLTRRRGGLRSVRELPLLPLAILVSFILIAIFANFIAPYDPTEPIPGAKIFEPPFWMQGGSTHALLGTDFQARDILSRLIFGSRVSLIVGVVGTIVAGSSAPRWGSSPVISAAGWIS
jgi:ABC-type dipeptide/oligopeptide/nickel transport system permease subunit